MTAARGVPERGSVVPLPQPVLPRFSFHPPPERQLSDRGQLGHYDRAVPDGRTDHRETPAAQRVEQYGEPADIDHHSLARRLERCVLTRVHRTLPVLASAAPFTARPA